MSGQGTVRVRMLSHQVGERFQRVIGGEYDVPPHEAERMCNPSEPGATAIAELVHPERRIPRGGSGGGDLKQLEKEWRNAKMKLTPQDYLERFPDGPNADLARQILDAATTDDDDNG